MTMKEVAKEAGVTETAISRFERGLVPELNPFPRVAAYARALEVEPAELWAAIHRQ